VTANNRRSPSDRIFTAQLTTPAGQTDWAARVFLLLDPDGRVREDYHLTIKPLPPA
jgi:hypothetical protein